MTNLQNSKEKMYVLMCLVSDSYPEVTASIKAFADGISRLKLITAEIAIIGSEQSADITGVTKSKDMDMEALKDSLMEVSGAVFSYAITQNDPAMQAKVNFKGWMIDAMTQPELMQTSGVVLQIASQIDPVALADLGISPQEMEAFRTNYTRYKDVRFEPREAIIDRSAQTKRLADLFTEAYNLKKNTLDRLAVQFQRKAPEFYQKYMAASQLAYKRSATTATNPVNPTPAD